MNDKTKKLEHRENHYTLKSIGTFIAVVGAFIAFIGLFWSVSTSVLRDQIESLVDINTRISENLLDLERKSEGLLEPTLWKIDTVRRAGDSLTLYGGRIAFRVKIGLPLKSYYREGSVKFNYLNSIEGIPGMEVASRDSNTGVRVHQSREVVIDVSNENFEFTADGQRYYLNLSPPNSDSNFVVGNFYALRPIWKPADSI